MNTREAISRRCSCRAYKPEQISEEELNALLESANYAPVGMAKYENLKFTVIQNRELLEEIDREGGKFFGDPERHPLYKAPTFIMVSALASNPHEREISMCNVSCIIENLMITASDMGLGTCYIMGNTAAIRDNQGICQKLNVPKDFIPCAGVVVGYPIEVHKEREASKNKIDLEYIR